MIARPDENSLVKTKGGSRRLHLLFLPIQAQEYHHHVMSKSQFSLPGSSHARLPKRQHKNSHLQKRSASNSPPSSSSSVPPLQNDRKRKIEREKATSSLKLYFRRSAQSLSLLLLLRRRRQFAFILSTNEISKETTGNTADGIFRGA